VSVGTRRLGIQIQLAGNFFWPASGDQTIEHLSLSGPERIETGSFWCLAVNLQPGNRIFEALSDIPMARVNGLNGFDNFRDWGVFCNVAGHSRAQGANDIIGNVIAGIHEDWLFGESLQDFFSKDDLSVGGCRSGSMITMSNLAPGSMASNSSALRASPTTFQSETRRKTSFNPR
jgi:hypothetical protein